MTDRDISNKTLTQILYGLYAAGFVIGVTPIIAIIMNYIKRDDVRGTWLDSHFVWQIKTFWYSMIIFLVGAVLMIALVGWAVWIGGMIWYIYRIVKGWLRLVDNQPVD